MIRLLRTLLASALLASIAMGGIAQEFPLTIEHKFGTTVISEKPQRVASVDFGGIGNLLALGVQPVAVLDWRDDYPFTAGPWAKPLLTSEPLVLAGDLDFEAIAGTDPDVIIALWSGISAQDYEKLSLIAPVVAVPEGVGDYALPWDERALTTGRAVGEEDKAVRQVDAIRSRLAEIRSDHPDWADLTAVVGGIYDGEFNAYNRNDVRAQFMAALGFDTPPALDDLTDDDGFNIRLTAEVIEPYDADVIVWYGMTAGIPDVLAFPARPYLRAYQKGGEVFLPDDVVAAFARVSLISIPAFIDALVPMLEAAADADPATEVEDARH